MELANRDEIELALTRALMAEGVRTRRELLKLLGDPPRIEALTVGVWAEIERRFGDILRPYLEEVFVQGALQLATSVGFGLAVDAVNQSAVQWAREYSFDLVRGINERRQKLLQDTVAQFYQEQVTNADLVRILEREFGPVRASMIAVTEVTRATAEGEQVTVQALREQGAVLTERWYTMEDERVCPICEPRHEKARGDGWQMLPPAHPNCRCFVTYDVGESS